MKRVWLNINTGEFSDSWVLTETLDKVLTQDVIADAATRGWKLIEYNCINDQAFELCDLMKVVTSDKSKNRQK